jgi:antitoxin ParD1/3/4
MDISLTKELSNFIEKKIQSGLYHSSSEVIREGLRLMILRERHQQNMTNYLNIAIAEGLDSSTWTTLDEVFSDIDT